MEGLVHTIAKRYPYSRREAVFRGILAIPFALSFVLALALGPGTIDSTFASFTWLTVSSLVITVFVLGVPPGWLLPLGLMTLISFPVLAGLAFYGASGWARPVEWIVFYGSIASSLAAAGTGAALIVRSTRRHHPRALAVVAGCLVALALVVAVSGVVGPTGYAGRVRRSMAAPTNMGPVINTQQREAEPSFTADGRTMVFNCRGTDICVSHRIGPWELGRWTPPEVLPPPISTSYIEVEPWINPTGDKLYFNSKRPFVSGAGVPGLALYVDAIGLIGERLGVGPFGGLGQDDIWVSELVDGAWSSPRNLNDVPGEPPVNTRFADHCLSFSADGTQGFWTSTRPGGVGGNDIWTSRLVHGAWTKPENLGPNVNGPGSDHHSIPSSDGLSLYVTSARAGGFGGDDAHITTRRADGSWGPLVNLGPLVNGPENDRCPAWTPDGRIVLFDSARAGGSGSLDLWWIYAADLRAPAGRHLRSELDDPGGRSAYGLNQTGARQLRRIIEMSGASGGR